MELLSYNGTCNVFPRESYSLREVFLWAKTVTCVIITGSKGMMKEVALHAGCLLSRSCQPCLPPPVPDGEIQLRLGLFRILHPLADTLAEQIKNPHPALMSGWGPTHIFLYINSGIRVLPRSASHWPTSRELSCPDGSRRQEPCRRSGYCRQE